MSSNERHGYNDKYFNDERRRIISRAPEGEIGNAIGIDSIKLDRPITDDLVDYRITGNTQQDTSRHIILKEGTNNFTQSENIVGQLGNVIIPFVIGTDGEIDLTVGGTTNGWWLVGALRHDVSRIQMSGLTPGDFAVWICDSETTPTVTSGASGITTDLADLQAKMKSIDFHDCKSVTGDLSDLMGKITGTLNLQNCSNITGIYEPLSGITYSTGLKYINLNGTAQTASDVNQTLINLAASCTSGNNGTNGIGYFNARTSASDAAIATLTGLGWDILCTDARNVEGAKFPTADINTSSDGIRLAGSVLKSASPSTDTVLGYSDFDSNNAFACVRVNGYVGVDGEFVETAIEGTEGSIFAIDGTNGDVWSRFNKSFFKYDFSDPNYEKIYISDIYVADDGWCPFQIFIKPNDTLRDYGYIACYEAGYNSDKFLSSISGVRVAYELNDQIDANKDVQTSLAAISHNSQITEFRRKGNQYCGMTTKDVGLLTELFKVEFATLDSQGIMYGAANYNYQYRTAVAETGAQRIIVTNAQANNLDIGSCVSLGIKDVSNISIDRYYVSMNSIVNRKKILSKTSYDANNTAINLDVTFTFDTTTDTFISTMPHWTGESNSVLSHSGSNISNTNGKHSMKYRHVENLYGNTYTILSDAIYKNLLIYQCNDVTKFTASAPTADYNVLSYSVPEVTGYALKLGYDSKSNTRFTNTNSTTYSLSKYRDYFYASMDVTGTREILYGGALNEGSNTGLFYFHVNYDLGRARWHIAARLSSCGSCGTTA